MQVKDILNSIKKLFAKTEDTGWQTTTLTDNFKCYNNDDNNIPKYRRVGKLIELNGAVSPQNTLAGSATGVTIFTLPERI